MYSGPKSHPERNWEALYENFTRERRESFAGIGAEEAPDSGDSASVFGPDAAAIDTSAAPQAAIQLRNSYIVTPSRDGLMLIDQYRAHTRILFDKYFASLASGGLPAQKVIFPESVTLSPSLNAAMTEIAERLPRLGFDVSYLGDCTWAINAVPAGVGSGFNAAETLEAIAGDAAQMTDGLADESILTPMALSMARATAIRHGRQLSSQEMDSIVADLFRCQSPGVTPDGLTILSIISNDSIADLFK